MNVVFTGVSSHLEDGLRALLGGSHHLSILDGGTLGGDCTSVSDVDVVVVGLEPETSAARDDIGTIEQATRGIWNLLTTTRARGILLLSTMRLFDAYDPVWGVDETWIPRPSDEPEQLAAHLAEVTSREIARARGIDVRVVRLDRVVNDQAFRDGPVGDDWLHLDDALSLLHRVIESFARDSVPAWRVLHGVRGNGRYLLGGASRGALEFQPAFPGPSLQPSSTVDLRAAYPDADEARVGLPEPRAITVFGAGGPLGAAFVEALGDRTDVVLRLTDVRPLAEVAAGTPQTPGAPRAHAPVAPHSEHRVDVSDGPQVLAAAAGADCLVNCSVVRWDVSYAFRVNVIGAYNVMRAAVAHGIRRVVQTGPALVLGEDPVGYAADRRVHSSTPPRSGTDLYFLTKLLAKEICRIVAERNGIACPVLLYTQLVSLDAIGGRTHPFAISWADAGRALVAASTVGSLREPSPMVHVRAPSPHGRYAEGEMESVLGWEPEDRLDLAWTRDTILRTQGTTKKVGLT